MSDCFKLRRSCNEILHAATTVHVKSCESVCLLSESGSLQRSTPQCLAVTVCGLDLLVLEIRDLYCTRMIYTLLKRAQNRV